MTNEQYVFHQDVKERKNMKSGAIHKKNGCKSKKCTLPSDYLSKKEKAKLSGPVISIKMNQPYSNWREFVKLPDGMQRDYIVNLIENYGARYADIVDMFNVSKTTFYKKCCSYDPPLTRRRGGQVKRSMDDRWLDFITKPEVTKKTEEIKPKEVETISERRNEMDEKKANPNYGVTAMKLDMNGNKQVIIDLFQAILNDNCEYNFSGDIIKIEGTSN